ncbi:type VI secretion protein, partial [Plantactinospora sp. CA-290183]
MTPYRIPAPTPQSTPSGPHTTTTTVPSPAPSHWVLHTGDWAADRPWLLAVAAGLLITWVAGGNLVALWRHQHHARGARLIGIAPPPQVDEHSAAALWANLAGILTPVRHRRLLYGAPHIGLQYTWTGRRLLISLWVPGSVPNGAVEAAVRAAWPGAATTANEPAPAPIPADTAAAVGGHLLPVAADWLPLTSDHDADPLRALMSAGAQLHDGEYACVQILARPAAPKRASRARRAAGRLRHGATALPGLNIGRGLTELIEVFLPGRGQTGGTAKAASRPDPTVERDVRAILDKTSHQLWDTG